MMTLLLVLGIAGVLWVALKVVGTLVRPWLQHRSHEGQYGLVLGIETASAAAEGTSEALFTAVETGAEMVSGILESFSS